MFIMHDFKLFHILFFKYTHVSMQVIFRSPNVGTTDYNTDKGLFILLFSLEIQLTHAAYKDSFLLAIL